MSRSTGVPRSSQIQTAALAAMSPSVTTGGERVGTLSRIGSTSRLLPDHERHNRLLRVQAVLGLVPHSRLRPVQDLLGDLLAPMRGQAVEDDGVVAGHAQQLVVDAEAGQVA